MVNAIWSVLESNYIRYDKDAWSIIGGNVFENHKSNPKGFSNSCTIRVSRALNKSGVPIPQSNGKTISGADKSWYFYRVKDLKSFLENRFGPADIVSKDKKKFVGTKGVICFEIDIWSDASGHFTLFDGKSALGGEHDTDFYFFNASKIHLWKTL